MQNKNKDSLRISLVLLAVVATVGSNSLLLSPILTDVARGLSTTPSAAARAIAAYGGATALSALSLAPFIDRFGLRRTLLYGLAALCAGISLSALAEGWLTLCLAQALAGLGAGVVLPASYALATRSAPRGQEARNLGRVLTGWSLSLVLGVPLSALIADAFGWRASFGVLALLALAAVAGLRLIPPCPGSSLHDDGAVVSSRSMAMSGILTREIVLLFAICFGYMVAFYGVYPFVGDHVRTVLGASTSHAGLFPLAYGIGFGMASLADGLLDRFGARRVFPIALLAVALAYAGIARGAGTLEILLGLCLLWGIANHFGLNILVLLLTEAAGPARGAVLGLNSAITYLGVLAGAAVFGPFYEHEGLSAVALSACACLILSALASRIALSSKSTGRFRTGL